MRAGEGASAAPFITSGKSSSPEQRRRSQGRCSNAAEREGKNLSKNRTVKKKGGGANWMHALQTDEARGEDLAQVKGSG